MKTTKSIAGIITLAVSLLLTASIRTMAQAITSIDQIPTNVKPVPEGQKMKIKAFILKRGSDSFIIRESNGTDTEVLLDSSTSVKTFRRDVFTTAEGRAQNRRVEIRVLASGLAPNIIRISFP